MSFAMTPTRVASIVTGNCLEKDGGTIGASLAQPTVGRAKCDDIVKGPGASTGPSDLPKEENS
jgi:hypothetical protein